MPREVFVFRLAVVSALLLDLEFSTILMSTMSPTLRARQKDNAPSAPATRVPRALATGSAPLAQAAPALAGMLRALVKDNAPLAPAALALAALPRALLALVAAHPLRLLATANKAAKSAKKADAR